MERKFTILIADDDPDIFPLIRDILAEGDYRLLSAGSGEEALGVMDRDPVDMLLVDYQMPGMDGLDLLLATRKRHRDVKVCMITGYGSVDVAINALQAGAVDFFQKPFSVPALTARVAHHKRLWDLARENLLLKKQAGVFLTLSDMVGNSRPMRRLKNLLERAAASDANVLIKGETGTGKEIAARCIHSLSARSAMPFVAVDCASLSETILESELFGHEKGAFTQAHTAHVGLARAADGGTLFLDETGEMPPALQSKFLRFLQTREVRPVGSAKSYPVNIRVVCATNRDLAQEVEEGRFRRDLYYRLHVVPVATPPLRECREDIALLASHFVHRYCVRNAVEKKLAKETILCLERHSWPGNVRELENAVHRAAVLSDGPQILPGDLPSEILCGAAQPAAHPPDEGLEKPAGDSMEDYERAAIMNALKKSSGNRNRAAEILGIGPATLYRKLQKYGLH